MAWIATLSISYLGILQVSPYSAAPTKSHCHQQLHIAKHLDHISTTGCIYCCLLNIH